MARVQYGALVTEIRGSIGGTTFQKNAFGFSVKNKSNPGNGFSKWRPGIRFNCFTAVQAWSQLDPEVRDEWNSFATTFPQPTKHNSTSYLSGYALFIKAQMINLLYSGSMVFTPSFIIPPLPGFSPVLSVAAGNLLLSWGESVSSPDLAQAVFMSWPVSNSRSGSRNALRFIGGQQGQVVPLSCDVPYAEHFGRIPAIGNTVQVSIKPFGWSAPWFYADQYFKLIVQDGS